MKLINNINRKYNLLFFSIVSSVLSVTLISCLPCYLWIMKKKINSLVCKPKNKDKTVLLLFYVIRHLIKNSSLYLTRLLIRSLWLLFQHFISYILQQSNNKITEIWAWWFFFEIFQIFSVTWPCNDTWWS